MRHVDIKMTKGVLVRTAGTSFALVLTTVGFAQTSVTDKDYGHLRRINNGMGPACAFETTFKPIQECRNSDSPEILIWGDSFAMHLVPGIMAAGNPAHRVVQATRGACGPLLGMAPMEITFRAGYNKTWAESCISFNDSVLQYLEKASSIKTVVLASPFGSFTDERTFQLLKRGSNGEDFSTVEAGIDPAVEGVKATVERVRALGKKIVVVAPPPNSGFDIGLCVERLETGRPIMGGPKECKVNQITYEKTNERVHKFLHALPQRAGVDVVDFDSFLCHSGSCETYIDGILIYRDAGHLSYEGSIFLAKKSDLVERIQKLAR